MMGVVHSSAGWCSQKHEKEEKLVWTWEQPEPGLYTKYKPTDLRAVGPASELLTGGNHSSLFVVC